MTKPALSQDELVDMLIAEADQLRSEGYCDEGAPLPTPSDFERLRNKGRDGGPPVSLNWLFRDGEECPFLGDEDASVASDSAAPFAPAKVLKALPSMLQVTALAEVASGRGFIEFSTKDRHGSICPGDSFVKALDSAKALLECVDHDHEIEALSALMVNNPPDPMTVAALIGLSRRKAREANARRAAGNKNSDAREWVMRRWVTRADQGQSKAAFARDCVHLVKRRFRVTVTADRIARNWLV